MSAQTPTSERRNPAPAQPEGAPRALRLLGLAAVGIGVAALAAATFVLSYPAIHVLALQAGVAPRLARGYPLLIDAMLVIVLAAVLALRGAGLPSRLLAWLTLLAVLAAAAGAGALHAAGRKLPDHVAAVTVAVLPWVLVFLAFALLLAMLRYARLRRAATGAQLAEQPDIAMEQPDLAIERAAPDDRGDDPASESTDVTMPYPADDADADMPVLSPVPAAEDEPAEPDMPVFHRMWSSPTPPDVQ
jgi:hypothetical protein